MLRQIEALDLRAVLLRPIDIGREADQRLIDVDAADAGAAAKRGIKNLNGRHVSPFRIWESSSPAGDDFAIFLGEIANVGVGQNIEHGLRRAAQPRALRRHDDRPIDEDRMFEHEVDQLVFRPLWIAKAERVIRRSLLPQQVARRNAHRLEQLDEPLARRRVFQIFDDDRLFAALADHRQRVARGAAGGVVIDGDGHAQASVLWP